MPVENSRYVTWSSRRSIPLAPLPVLTSLHYLRSARSGSRYFALVDPVESLPGYSLRVPASNGNAWEEKYGHSLLFRRTERGTFRECILLNMRHRMPFRHSCRRSRTYLRHNVSIGRSANYRRRPKLGLHRGSYRAANWQQWMTVRARPYLYEDGGYVSPRQFHQRYGTASLVELRAKYADRSFQQSKVRLLDPIIYCCNVTGATKIVLCTTEASPESLTPAHVG